MGKWLRVDAQHPQHWRFEDAGHWGWSISVAAWCIAKAFDLPDGEITQFWRARTLAHWCHLDQLPDGIGRAEEGMQAALRVELIIQRGNRYYIRNWNDYQRDTTATERKRRQRKRQKDSKQSDSVTRDMFESQGVTRDTEMSRPDRTGQDKTGQDGTGPSPKNPDSGNGSSRPEWQQLLRYYYEQCRELHCFKPVLKWEGSDGNTAKAILREYELEAAEGMVDRYLALKDRRVQEAGYPFSWIPSRIGQLAATETEAERGKEVEQRMREAGILVEAH